MDHHTVTSLHSSDQVVAIASAGHEIPSGAPDWVKLLPYGTFAGRDGRGPYTLAGPASASKVIAASTAYQRGADYPVDYEHQTQMAAKNGQPAPASGWIKELEARDDGLYARVDWTAAAAQRIETREYRYISPAFIHDKGGQVLRIVGAGLVALPNLEIPALAGQQDPATQGDSMDPILKALLRAFGLAETATSEQIAAHAQALAEAHQAALKFLGLPAATPPGQVATAAQGLVAGLAKAIGLDGEVTVATLATAAQGLADKAKASGQVDLTRYVPMDVHLAVAGQLTALQGQTSQSEAVREVDAAIEAGKLTPALKEWGLAMASQSLDAFRGYIAKAPVLVATHAQRSSVTTGQPPATGGQQLTADELAVASQLGLTPEQFAKGKEII